jgi:DNA-binding MarR family transcriptional regulator
MTNICYGFFKVAMRMRARLDESIKDYHLITPQYAMLRILNIEGRMTQVELGTYLAMDKATMVRMLDSLEELKYVKRVRNDQDRRSKFLELTPAGKKIMAAIEKIRNASEAEFLSPLTAQEQSHLRAIVRKLLD